MNKNVIYNNLLIFNEFKNMVKYFPNVKIFRGVVYNLLFYNFKREMEDIDLIVPKKFLYKTIDKLKELGFNQSKSGEYIFYKNNLILDIHTDFWFFDKEDNETLIKNDYTFWDKAGDSWKTILPEFMLIDCISHSVHHGYIDKRWIEDFSNIYKYFCINENYFFHLIKKYYMQNLLKIYKENKTIKKSNNLKLKIIDSIIRLNKKDEFGYISRGFIFKNWWQSFLYFSKTLFPTKTFLVRRYNVKNSLVFIYFFIRPFLQIFKFLNLVTKKIISL